MARLRASYRSLTGRDLIPAAIADADAPAALEAAPFGVVSHGTGVDPVFNYANRCALDLFAMDWASFTCLPSRYSAPATDRESRAHLLERVTAHGYADDYHGLRIAADGRRFMIEDTTIWNVADENGNPAGQAARIGRWRHL